MAKVTGPLFSVDASGKLANSIVFSKWRGINTVRQWAKPANPDTVAQQEVRSNFQDSVDDYHTLSGDDKQAWTLSVSGQPLSGYNLFMGVSVKTKTEFDDFNFLRNVCTDYTAGGEDETEIEVIPKHGGTAQILYGPKADKLINKVSIDLNAGEESSTFLTDLVENQEYYFKLVQPVETIADDEIYGETGIYSFVHQIPVTEDNYVNANYSIV